MLRRGGLFQVVRWIGDIILYFVRLPGVGSNRNIMPFTFFRWTSYRLIVVWYDVCHLFIVADGVVCRLSEVETGSLALGV